MEKKWTCEEDILCGVHQPKASSALTDLDKKHLPVIEAPAKVNKGETFDVFIEVGKMLAHPNEPAHFIEWIELYCGDTFLGNASFSGGSSYPKVCFRVNLSHSHGPLKAWGKCNLHGLWESVKEISVE